MKLDTWLKRTQTNPNLPVVALGRRGANPILKAFSSAGRAAKLFIFLRDDFAETASESRFGLKGCLEEILDENPRKGVPYDSAAEANYVHIVVFDTLPC